MFLTWEQLLEMRELGKYQVVAGKGGLSRLIVWYNICERVNYREEEVEDNLIFVAGVGMTNPQGELYEIVKMVYEKGAVGVIVEKGPYIEEISEEIISYANQRNFPLLTIPFEVQVSRVTYVIAKKIAMNKALIDGMKEVLNELFQTGTSPELEARAAYYGYRTQTKYFTMIIENIKETEENEEAQIRKMYLSCINTMLRMDEKDFFCFIKEKAVVVLLVCEDEDVMKQKAENFFSVLRQDWHYQNQQWCMNIGVGMPFDGMGTLNQSILQAEEAIHMTRVCHKKEYIQLFEDTGVYRLFYEYNNTNELKDIYYSILRPLMIYDSEHEGCLMETLEIFLESNCNIGITAEQMNLHRNTVKYRVNNIEKILNIDFGNHLQCFNLRLAMKIKKYIN